MWILSLSLCVFFFSLCLYFCMPQRQRELLGYERSCRADFLFFFFFFYPLQGLREGGRERGREDLEGDDIGVFPPK